ncbi:helix-turn-helix domain-containing protein [Streptomyces virginiae]|uniref:helix-turn-helix domain-containing protein n=1 Tax=Streptomyces virginiae TaxID=1961 RepID=UPI00341C10B2
MTTWAPPRRTQHPELRPERSGRRDRGGGPTAERQVFRERVRMEAVGMFADGRGSTEIAKELLVSVRSVQRWHQA